MTSNSFFFCVWKRFQLLIYLRMTTIHGAVPRNAFSPWLTWDWQLFTLLLLGTLSFPNVLDSDNALIPCLTREWPLYTLLRVIKIWQKYIRYSVWELSQPLAYMRMAIIHAIASWNAFFKFLTHLRVTTKHAPVSGNAFSPWITLEWKFYRLLCLRTFLVLY